MCHHLNWYTAEFVAAERLAKTPAALQAPVTCRSCRQKFSTLTWAPPQGCDATVTGNEISCGYGSEFDNYVYDIMIRPEWLAPGEICDACIKRAMTDGELELKYGE